MASLNEISQLCYDQIFPLPRGKNAIDIEEFKANARLEYANSMWIYRMEILSAEGQFQMPSDLLTESDPLPVVNNEIDISELKYLSALPNDLWLQNIGGHNCECNYIKTNINLNQILCDDDSIGNDKIYYIVGKKIKFPRGTHSKNISIIYANNGSDIDDDIEVNEYVGAKVRDKLLSIYGKSLPVDETNNNSINN
jgi:hypothetical protein